MGVMKDLQMKRDEEVHHLKKIVKGVGRNFRELKTDCWAEWNLFQPQEELNSLNRLLSLFDEMGDDLGIISDEDYEKLSCDVQKLKSISDRLRESIFQFREIEKKKMKNGI